MNVRVSAPPSTDELVSLDASSFEITHTEGTAGRVATAFLHLRHPESGIADDLESETTERQCPVVVATMTDRSPASSGDADVTPRGCTYERLWEALRSAQQSTSLELYYGSPCHLGALTHILLTRAGSGMRVFILYDACGTLDVSEEQRRALRAGGVTLEPFRPVRLSTLHHSRLRGVVVGSHIGWTGGFGIDGKWLGDGRSNGSWRETGRRFEGSAVREVQAALVAAAWSMAVAPGRERHAR